MNDIYFNKLPFDGGFFLIQTKWGTENIDINMHETTQNKTFKGKLNLKEMEEDARELEMPFIIFVKECRSALTTNCGLPSFKYDLNIEQKKLLLIKKDVYTIIQYLDIKIIEDSQSTSQMLERAIDFINVQNQKHCELQERKQQLQKCYQETCDHFERSLEEKNSMERKLIKKCALLLNTKKAKITELLTEIENNEEEQDSNDSGSVDDEQPSTSYVARKQIKKKDNTTKFKKISTDKDHSDYDDDDEDDYLASTQVVTCMPEETVKNIAKRRKTTEDDSVSMNKNEYDQEKNNETD